MKKLYLILTFLLLTAFLYSDDSETFNGELEAKAAEIDNRGNDAKFNEYSDQGDGFYGRLKFLYDSERYFLKFNAQDMGYRTQSYELEGGSLTIFRMYFKYNEIPHNFTYDARTIFSGAGTDKLTASSHFLLGDPSTYTPANLFDYSILRKYGEGGFKLDILKPFYFNVSFSREGKDGIKPAAIPLTMGGGSYFVELPEPVSYTTNNLNAEWGYAKNPLFLSLSYFKSEFSNKNEYLFFTNVYNISTFGAPKDDYLTLPPDSKSDNLNFKGTVKLPLKTTLNLKFSHTNGSSRYNLMDYYVRNVTGGIQNVTLSDLKFDGKFSTKDYDIIITSRPLSFLFAKIFYNSYDKENKSDRITQTDSNVNGGNPFTPHLFDYKKQKSGVEFDLKLISKLSLISGYTFLKVDRHRGDLPETEDDIYTLDLRWKGVDFVVAKLGYERIDRSAVHHIPETLFETDQALANVVEQFLFRFDGAPMERDTYKASFEIYPLEALYLNLHYKDKKSSYKETILGLKSDKRREFGMDFDLKIGNFATLSAYGKYEKSELPQFQRYSIPSGTLDPFAPGNADSYNWQLTGKNKTYNYGGLAELIAIPEKLSFNLNYDYIKSDGISDFSFFDYTPQQNSDILNVDDYVRKSFSLKATYLFNDNFSFSACYIYENFNYKDIAVDGYDYTYNGGSDTSITSLTGAYMEPSYKANQAFISISYKF